MEDLQDFGSQKVKRMNKTGQEMIRNRWRTCPGDWEWLGITQSMPARSPPSGNRSQSPTVVAFLTVIQTRTRPADQQISRPLISWTIFDTKVCLRETIASPRAFATGLWARGDLGQILIETPTYSDTWRMLPCEGACCSWIRNSILTKMADRVHYWMLQNAFVVRNRWYLSPWTKQPVPLHTFQYLLSIVLIQRRHWVTCRGDWISTTTSRNV